MADVQAARKFNPAVRASLAGFSDEDVLQRIRGFKPGAAAKSGDPEDPRFRARYIAAVKRGHQC